MLDPNILLHAHGYQGLHAMTLHMTCMGVMDVMDALVYAASVLVSGTSSVPGSPKAHQALGNLCIGAVCHHRCQTQTKPIHQDLNSPMLLWSGGSPFCLPGTELQGSWKLFQGSDGLLWTKVLAILCDGQHSTLHNIYPVQQLIDEPGVNWLCQTCCMWPDSIVLMTELLRFRWVSFCSS